MSKVLVIGAGLNGLVTAMLLTHDGHEVTVVERDATEPNITTFGDALWWAATTVTTVGYGDRYPVSTEGRVVAVVLMGVGIGVMGAVIASVTSFILARVEEERRSA